MTTKSKFAVAAALAAFAIASPAFGQSFDPTVGTGNVLPFAYDASGAIAASPTLGRVARARSGLDAYAMIPRRHVQTSRPIYNYSGFDAPSYDRLGPSGYDPSIATQR